MTAILKRIFVVVVVVLFFVSCFFFFFFFFFVLFCFFFCFCFKCYYSNVNLFMFSYFESNSIEKFLWESVFFFFFVFVFFFFLLRLLFFQFLAKIEIIGNKNRLFGCHLKRYNIEKKKKKTMENYDFFFFFNMVQISLQNSGGIVVFLGTPPPTWAPTEVKVPWSLNC